MGFCGPAAGADDDVMNVWQARSDNYSIVQCAMVYGLEPGLQRRFEHHGAYEMFQELNLTFQANARVQRYEVSNKFYNCKMEESSSVSEHILKMSGYHNHLTQLGVELPVESVIDRVLQSLPPSYARDDKNDSRALRDAEIGGGRNQNGASRVDGQ